MRAFGPPLRVRNRFGRKAKLAVLSSAALVASLLALPTPASAAPSGTLGFARIEGYWVAAGGPASKAATAAAIAGAESTYYPGNIQPNQAYSQTGWGLWQITPGNSESQFCVDFRLLDPWNNAEAAVAKFRAAGDSFSPWTTYNDGAYRSFLPANPPAPKQASDPGEYIQVHSAPSGTHNSANPGGTCGPKLSTPAFAFWKGTNGDLYEGQGPADGSLNGPFDRGMGPLGSEPSAGVDDSGATYVYWKGTNDQLMEAYWDGNSWVGPFNRGMGPLASAPTVAINGAGKAFVFWKGSNGDLIEAQGPATGDLNGPYDRGMGPLGSAPSAGIDASGATYVYWKGTTGDLFEGYWDGNSWVGPYNRGMSVLGSAPSAAITSDGRALVFWKSSTTGDLIEAQGPANGDLNGPFNRGMGPLGSAPSAGVDSTGASYVYWKGTTGDLFEGYWDGNSWAGPVNLGMGTLGSGPGVAVSN